MTQQLIYEYAKLTATPNKRVVNLRPTLSDIAKGAGVAVCTASAILNNSQHCYASENTRAKVLEVARMLEYRNNPFASSPKQQKTHLIGLVIHSLASPNITMKKFSDVEVSAREKDYRVLIGNHQMDAGIERDTLLEFLAAKVDGVIIYPTGQKLDRVEGNGDLVCEMVRQKIPVVTIESPYDFPTYNVTVDRELGGYMQVEHLVKASKRRNIAFLLQNCQISRTGMHKFNGYHRAISEFGDSIDNSWLIQSNDHSKQPYDVANELIDSLLEKIGKVDSVVLSTDTFALPLMSRLAKAGIRVPEDIAIIGFDDEDFSKMLPVPLTTIMQPKDVGNKAFELLYEQMNNKDGVNLEKIPNVKLLPSLIVRESTL